MKVIALKDSMERMRLGAFMTGEGRGERGEEKVRCAVACVRFALENVLRANTNGEHRPGS